MVSREYKNEVLKSRDLVREMFRLEWDLIGLGDDENCRDEYDRYADQAFSMIMRGSTAVEIEDFLSDIALRHMGLDNSLEIRRACEHAATKLMALLPQIKNALSRASAN